MTLAIAAAHPAVASGRPIDAAFVEREVADALRVANTAEAAVRRGVELAREAFASHVEVPEAMVRREDEMVRLGRMDARAS